MQVDEDAGDYINRAKTKLAAWGDMREEAARASRFDRCTAVELVAIAETRKDLAGKKLTPGDLYGLYGAWQQMFGEPLGLRTEHRADSQTEASLDEHPLLSVPDDTMLRPRDVIRLCGVSRTTLKRWRRLGRFPKPQRSAPLTNHIGWPARQVKAWLRAEAS